VPPKFIILRGGYAVSISRGTDIEKEWLPMGT